MIEVLFSRSVDGSSTQQHHLFSDSEDEMSCMSKSREEGDPLSMHGTGYASSLTSSSKPTRVGEYGIHAVIPSSAGSVSRQQKEPALVYADEEDDHRSGTTESIDDMSVASTISQSSSMKRMIKDKFNTMSFMEYLKARRNARQQLNGELSSLNSHNSHSRTGVLSTYSMDLDALPLPQHSQSDHVAVAVASSTRSKHLAANLDFNDSILTGQSPSTASLLAPAAATAAASLSSSSSSSPSPFTSTAQHPATTVVPSPSAEGKTPADPPMDVVGNRFQALLTKNSSGHLLGDGKSKKVLFPVKNIMIDAGSVGPQAKASSRSAKAKIDPNNQIRNGFNADLGLVVKMLPTPHGNGVVGKKESSSTSGSSFTPSLYNPEGSVPDAVAVSRSAPTSEASVALSELYALKQQRVDSFNELVRSSKEDADDNSSIDSREARIMPNISSSGILSLPALEEEYVSAENSAKQSIRVRSPSSMKGKIDLSDDITSNGDSSAQAEPLRPVKRSILGPFPSAYFLSNGSSPFAGMASAVEETDIPLPPKLSAPVTVITTEEGRESATERTINHNLQGMSTHSFHDVINAKHSNEAVHSHFHGTRGILRGMAMDGGGSPHADLASSRQRATPSSIHTASAADPQYSRSTTLLPPFHSQLSRSLSGLSAAQSMPSLLIKPVVSSVQPKTSSSGLKTTRVDSERIISEYMKEIAQGPQEPNRNSVIDCSVKSLTTLSNSEFEHLKNSIEVSVNGAGNRAIYHIHHPQSQSQSASRPTVHVPTGPPHMSLQHVGVSPVKYDCHKSFLSITGSRETSFSPFESQSRHPSTSGGNHNNVLTTAGSRSLSETAMPVALSAEAVAPIIPLVDEDEAGDGGKKGLTEREYVQTINLLNKFQIQSQLYAKHEFSHAPWVPSQMALPADNNRSNRILGWKEKLEILKNIPYVPAKTTMTIKSQEALRVSFEEFVRASPKKLGRVGQQHGLT